MKKDGLVKFSDFNFLLGKMQMKGACAVVLLDGGLCSQSSIGHTV